MDRVAKKSRPSTRKPPPFLALFALEEATMQRATPLIFVGIALIIAGVLGLKLTGLNYWWAAIALGGIVGCTGGIKISLNVR